jgi:hypothetical protein
MCLGISATCWRWLRETKHLYRGCGSGGACTSRAVPAHIFGVTFDDAEALRGAAASATPPKEIAVFTLVTGVNHRVAAYRYRGGSLLERREFSMAGTLVKHPQGDLLIDTGFGRDIDADWHNAALHQPSPLGHARTFRGASD